MTSRYTLRDWSDLIYTIIFWSIIIGGIVFISYSHPMMKVTYDIWQHLGSIDKLVLHPNLNDSRYSWYATWALLFRTLQINDVFEYALVIHRVQFLACCAIIYFTSKLFFEALISQKIYNNKHHLVSSFAISCVLVWLTIIGTVSTFQQAWMMWYSVNYQITLPFLFLALIINALTYTQSKALFYTKIIISAILLYLIFIFHAAELVYLIIYCPLLIICFVKKISKNLLIFCMVFFIIITYMVKQYFYQYIHHYIHTVPEIISLLANSDFSGIQESIRTHGNYNIKGGNRYSANWNELYAISFFIMIPITGVVLFTKIKINKRIIVFLLGSLLFCLIPSFIITSGIASLISYPGIVNRYYFASYIFMLLPLFIFLVMDLIKTEAKPIGILFGTILVVLTIFMYSKSTIGTGVLYSNVKSLLNSLNQSKVGLDYSAFQINSIKHQIDFANQKYKNEKYIFCASYRDSYIIKYLLRQENILFERRHPYTMRECGDHAKSTNSIPVYVNDDQSK